MRRRREEERCGGEEGRKGGKGGREEKKGLQSLLVKSMGIYIHTAYCPDSFDLDNCC